MSNVFPTIDLGRYANMPVHPIGSYDPPMSSILGGTLRPVGSAFRSASRSLGAQLARAFQQKAEAPKPITQDVRLDLRYAPQPTTTPSIPPARPGGMGITPEGVIYGTLPPGTSWLDLMPRAGQWQYEPHARPLEAVEAQKRLLAMTGGLPALTGQTFPAAMQHAMDRMWEINQANQRASLLARLLSGL